MTTDEAVPAAEEASAQPPPPVTAPDERLAYRGPIQRLLVRPEIGALIGAAVIWVFFWAVSDVFGTSAGVNNYLDVSATLGIMSVAVALLMIGGEFDLSSGAMTGATGMLVVLLAKDVGEFGGAGLPLTISIPVVLAFAVGVGWVNGTLVERTALPSFIVTLGTFFVLRGAKLGFAKLFTDKVIVEGLDNAPDHAFWENIFGATWIRNDHLWDSFLGGRDVVYGVILVLGVAALFIGLLELTFRRKTTYDTSGLGVFAVGVVAAIAGLIQLTNTDGTGTNWTWSLIMGAGIVVAAYGFARWRYEPRAEDRGTLALDGRIARNAALGVGAVVLGVVFGLAMDSSSRTELGFLLTVQGLRAMLFAGLAVLGVILLMLAARDAAKTSPITSFALTTVTAVVVAAVAFVVQSEAASRKLRAELFAVLLLAALVLFVSALLRLLFTERRAAEPAADGFGRTMAIVGIFLVFVAIAIRLLWATTVENQTVPGVFSYRISVMYFLVFTLVAQWVLVRTKFGSWTFAVGGNKNASRQVGVPAARTKTTLFIVVAVSAWLVGMLIAFRLNSVQANVGDGNEFFYIIAAVVGGNLLTGGYGSAAGAAIGALIMAMSFQGIPFAGWNSDWRFLFVGVILLLAVLVNNYVRRKAESAS